MTLQCWNKMALSQKIYNVILHSLPAGQKNYNEKTVEEDPPLPTDTFEQPPLPEGPPPEVCREQIIIDDFTPLIVMEWWSQIC